MKKLKHYDYLKELTCFSLNYDIRGILLSAYLYTCLSTAAAATAATVATATATAATAATVATAAAAAFVKCKCLIMNTSAKLKCR